MQLLARCAGFAGYDRVLVDVLEPAFVLRLGILGLLTLLGSVLAGLGAAELVRLSFDSPMVTWSCGAFAALTTWNLLRLVAAASGCPLTTIPSKWRPGLTGAVVMFLWSAAWSQGVLVRLAQERVAENAMAAEQVTAAVDRASQRAAAEAEIASLQAQVAAITADDHVATRERARLNLRQERAAADLVAVESARPAPVGVGFMEGRSHVTARLRALWSQPGPATLATLFLALLGAAPVVLRRLRTGGFLAALQDYEGDRVEEARSQVIAADRRSQAVVDALLDAAAPGRTPSPRYRRFADPPFNSIELIVPNVQGLGRRQGDAELLAVLRDARGSKSQTP